MPNLYLQHLPVQQRNNIFCIMYISGQYSSWSRPLSVITTDSDHDQLNSSFSPSLSHSSVSPPPRHLHQSPTPRHQHQSPTPRHQHQSPPRSQGTVFSTLYRPGQVTLRQSVGRPTHLSQDRHSSYITPTITIDTGTPSPSQGWKKIFPLLWNIFDFTLKYFWWNVFNSGSSRQSNALDKFDEAFENYKQFNKKKKNYKTDHRRSTIETERYFDNLAALLRSGSWHLQNCL